MDTVLIIIGYIVDKVQRLNIVALRRYKTNLFKKRINPNINHICLLYTSSRLYLDWALIKLKR